MKNEVYSELRKINESKRRAIIEKHISNGVLIPCCDGVIIGEDVKIGRNTLILKGTVLLGNTEIAGECKIGFDSLIYESKIGSGAALNCVQCFESEVGENADIGPFVHIRPGSVIKNQVHLGNFVEVKNSVIGEKTKVSHLTYVGDSDVGNGVNFGCGCVTVNFDGKNKHRTKIGNRAFIGCNTNLVAPVKIGERAYTAAGSTVTEDVPDDCLAIGRARQVNKEGWVIKKSPYRE
ncbi:MAG: hypothetical protein MJ177_02120 [Clostridia bacterium]|nr:hypothetical protein [Clostridia bacterium]